MKSRPHIGLTSELQFVVEQKHVIDFVRSYAAASFAFFRQALGKFAGFLRAAQSRRVGNVAIQLRPIGRRVADFKIRALASHRSFAARNLAGVFVRDAGFFVC